VVELLVNLLGIAVLLKHASQHAGTAAGSVA
jgi:hypothetical protein